MRSQAGSAIARRSSFDTTGGSFDTTVPNTSPARAQSGEPEVSDARSVLNDIDTSKVRSREAHALTSLGRLAKGRRRIHQPPASAAATLAVVRSLPSPRA
jgi:hypothetical protein